MTVVFKVSYHFQLSDIKSIRVSIRPRIRLRNVQDLTWKGLIQSLLFFLFSCIHLLSLNVKSIRVSIRPRIRLRNVQDLTWKGLIQSFLFLLFSFILLLSLLMS
jgi:hypothetical protein